jgi:hypothetical protein
MCDSKVNKQIRTHTRILLAKLSYFSNSPKNDFCQLQFERTDWSQSRGQVLSRFRICSFPEFQQRILSRIPNIPRASKELDSGKINSFGRFGE